MVIIEEVLLQFSVRCHHCIDVSGALRTVSI